MNETTDALRALEKEALEREAEKAELERLRQEREAAEERARAEQEAREKAAAAEREAAAAREAELQRQLDAMKAQMAALQPKVEAPAAAPAETAPLDLTGTGYTSHNFGIASAPDTSPIGIFAESPSCAAVAPKPVRPSDVAMVSILAAHYDAEPAVVLDWLADFNVSAARAQLAL